MRIQTEMETGIAVLEKELNVLKRSLRRSKKKKSRGCCREWVVLRTILPITNWRIVFQIVEANKFEHCFETVPAS